MRKVTAVKVPPATVVPIDERPPPGEAGVELSAADSIEALSDALLDITGEPRVRFSNVKDIEVTRVGRWVIVTVKSKGDPNELTFRINRAWATALCSRLKRAIEG